MAFFSFLPNSTTKQEQFKETRCNIFTFWKWLNYYKVYTAAEFKQKLAEQISINMDTIELSDKLRSDDARLKMSIPANHSMSN